MNVFEWNCAVFVCVDFDDLYFCIVCVDVGGYVLVSECYIVYKISE